MSSVPPAMPPAMAPERATSRLIAGSQLACVVLLGVMLATPQDATARLLGAAFVLACVSLAAAARSIAHVARGAVRAVLAAVALFAGGLAAGELWLLAAPATAAPLGLQRVNSLALAIAIAALNALLALYGTFSLAVQRRATLALAARVSAEREVSATLERRVTERTLELDDAQRVLRRMWWLGQQITLELNPRNVLDRFLEAAGDIAQADGAALGLVAQDGFIELVAASGTLAEVVGEHLPMSTSAIGRAIRGGGRWSVADVGEHPEGLDPRLHARLASRARGMGVVPMQRRGERIGAVAITTESARAFTSLELDRVEAMADLLSVALANADLFETMRRAEWRFRTLFRAAPDAVLTVLQATGRVREANDAVYTVFGLEPHQVVGRTLVELILPDDQPLLLDAIARAHAGGPARVEVRVPLAGGTRVVSLAASRLPEADPPSALLVGRDVTAERELRMRLTESDRLAAVGELVAGVAHEVNNPLSSISAFAQLLLRDAGLSDEQRESVEIIRSETLRASQVVRDLLAFARRSEPQQAPVDLSVVVARTLRIRQQQLTEARVKVVADLAPDLPSVIGDARQLQQVCLNLLANAVQAMSGREGSVLRVRTYQDATEVVLDVTDTGPGIAPDVQRHVFEPFFTTRKEGEGPGLGLSVSYGIITAHGGRIVVADTSGRGTTLRVTLPAGASAPAESSAPPFALRSPLAGIRLLLVDDEAAVRSAMDAWGARRGVIVVPADDGLAALELSRTVGVDAVLCQVRMPRMDGAALHDALLGERPGLAARTIFTTGERAAPAPRGAAARQPLLTKPFTFERLEEALGAVLRGSPFVEL